MSDEEKRGMRREAGGPAYMLFESGAAEQLLSNSFATRVRSFPAFSLYRGSTSCSASASALELVPKVRDAAVTRMCDEVVRMV